MSKIAFANARVLTLVGSAGARRGADSRDLGVIERGYVIVEGDRIVAVGSGPPEGLDSDDDHLVDASGSVIMPAFIDCHTHACWAGSRLDEFERTIQGARYLDILESGGGIMSTVRAVRIASEDELIGRLLRRLAAMAALGTGTIEVKSGYGLTTADELKMLRAVHAVSQLVPQTVVGTFLGAHAIDPDRDRDQFIDDIVTDALPTVAQEFPEIVCDAYCEEGAWSLAETTRLFDAARELGCPLRVHADQFNSLGMTRRAVEMGAVSVDHLEATTEAELEQLAASSTFGVMLPASSFHLNGPYGDGRRFLDAGGALALATNFNPGSAPSPSMPFTIALATRHLGLTPAEAITCTTWNPACLLGVSGQVGSLEPGKRADLQLLDLEDERELAWEFGGAGPLVVMVAGTVVHARGLEPEEAVEEQDDE